MRFFLIKGKKYILNELTHRNGTDKFELIPYDEKKYNEDIDFIIKKTRSKVNKDKILKNALMMLGYTEISKLKKALEHKVKITERNGCYEIGVGKQRIYVNG